MAEDRRVRKTKKALQDVFCEMIKEKTLNEITIKELCARADINKSTFYLHYSDIYDLADSVQNLLIQGVCAIIDEYDYTETVQKAPEMWKRIADTHFKDSKSLGSLLKRNGMISVVHNFEQAVIDTIMKKYVEAGIRPGSESYFRHHLNVAFIINGYIGILREFDVAETEDAMIEISRRLSTGFNIENEYSVL